MQLNAREDVEAPLDFVYDALSDFEGWERGALRRGIDVIRIDTLRTPGPGMGWSAEFTFRGKPRTIRIKLVTLDRPNRISFSGEGASLDGTMDIDLVELGARRTRVTVSADTSARTMAARLFLQSLKLARAKVNKRFASRIALIAAEIEDKYKRSLKS